MATAGNIIGGLMALYGKAIAESGYQVNIEAVIGQGFKRPAHGVSQLATWYARALPRLSQDRREWYEAEICALYDAILEDDLPNWAGPELAGQITLGFGWAQFALLNGNKPSARFQEGRA